jgi:hypothetical protein
MLMKYAITAMNVVLVLENQIGNSVQTAELNYKI